MINHLLILHVSVRNQYKNRLEIFKTNVNQVTHVAPGSLVFALQYNRSIFLKRGNNDVFELKINRGWFKLQPVFLKLTLLNEKFVLSYSLQFKQSECWSIQIRLIFAELQFIDAQKQNEIYVHITDCQYSQKNLIQK